MKVWKSTAPPPPSAAEESCDNSPAPAALGSNGLRPGGVWGFGMADLAVEGTAAGASSPRPIRVVDYVASIAGDCDRGGRFLRRGVMPGVRRTLQPGRLRGDCGRGSEQ